MLSVVYRRQISSSPTSCLLPSTSHTPFHLLSSLAYRHHSRLLCPRPAGSTILDRRRMTDFVPPAMFAERLSSSSSSAAAVDDLKTDALQDPTTTTTTTSSGKRTEIVSHNQYHTSGLDTSDLLPSPLALFQRWFENAQAVGVHEPEAMVLSTVSAGCRPSSRVVLLKSIHPSEGLTFYTNYASRKASELHAHPHAAITFYWREISRSVRFCGKVLKVDRQESQRYFDSRPIGSRVGAHASPQSRPVKSREELEELVRAKEEELGLRKKASADEAAPGGGGGGGGGGEGQESDSITLPVPDHWGGYRFHPYEVEFWCGRPNRLHDRFRYTRSEDSQKLAGDDDWEVQRLAP